MGCAKHDSNVRFISYGEVAIGRGRHWGKRLPSGDRFYTKKSRSGEVAIGGRGCDQEIVSTRRSRDQEIAPTGEGGGRDQEIAPTGEVSGGGRDQEIAPTGEVSGGGRDQEIAPTAVRDGECVAIGGRGCHREIVSTRREIRRSIREIVSTRRSRDQEIAPTAVRDGECVAIGRRGRDQEIAPTAVRDGECVAIGRRGRDQEIAPTAFSDNYLFCKNKAVEFPPPLCRLVHIDLSLKHLCYSRDDFNSPQVVVALPAAPMCPLRRCARVRVWRFPSNETSSIW